MSKPLYTVSEEEKYFFDLRGYLIIRGALSQADLSECNATIDHYADQIKTRSIEGGGLSRGSTTLTGQEGRRELTALATKWYQVTHDRHARVASTASRAFSEIAHSPGCGFPAQ